MKKLNSFILILFCCLILIGCHKHSFKAEVTNPTCTEQGYTTYTCSCGKDSYKDNYVNALGHSYGEWAIIKEATETEKGLKERKCSRCNDKQIEDIAIKEHTHKYTEEVIFPTCVEKGYTLYTCKCGDSYQDNYVDALGHTEVIVPKVEATCIDVGLIDGKKCSVCNTILVKQTEIKAKGHTETDWIIDSEATCTENGSKHKECSVCKETLKTEVISSTGHSYIETITNPTCTTQGYTTYKCSCCSDTYKDNYINALGHTEVILPKIEATCTEVGLTIGKKCLVCEEVLVKQDEIKAKGHTETDWIIDKETTCTNNGSKHKECDVCKETLKTEVISSTGHNYIETITNPTCTTQGYTTYKCSRCNDTYNDNYVDALGHTEAIIPKVDATCTTSGLTEGKKCLVCEEVLVKQEVIKAKGHNYSDWKVVKEATEETTGLKEKECSRCNDKQTEIIPELSHTHKYTDSIINPTCEDKGYTLHTCKCGDSYKDNYTNELGHNYGEVSYVWSSDYKTVSATMICQNDNNHIEIEKVSTTQTITQNKTCLLDELTTFKAVFTNQAFLTQTKENIKTNEKINHINNVYHEKINATCTTNGTIEYWSCPDCGKFFSDKDCLTEATDLSIKALGHTEVILSKIDATCITSGLTEGKKCSICEEVLIKQEEIKAKGHTESDWIIDSEATCTNNGSKHKDCTICKETIKIEVIDLVEHNYKKLTSNPTCTTQGYTLYTCTKCNYSYKDNYIAATGHIETDWIIDSEATCTKNGSKHKECSECKETLKTETINSTGHKYDETIINPNCTTQGYTLYTCSKCTYSYKDNYTNVLEHNFSNQGNIILLNDNTKAIKRYNCLKCTNYKDEIYTGYYLDNNNAYYFNDLGNKEDINESFINYNGNTYYIINNIIIKNYYIIDGTIYDFGNDGIKQDKAFNEGFITIDNKEYYVEENNKIATGNKIINDQVYNFGTNGAKQNTNYNNQFLDVNGNTYYIINNIIIKNYYIIDGTIYDFGTDGIKQDKIFNEGFITIDNKEYYVEKNNKIATGNKIINDKIYNFGTNGVKQNTNYNNQFLDVNGNTYYIINNIIIKNYYIIDGTIYDFGTDGIKQDILLNEEIVEVNNNKYYVLNNIIQVNTYILYNQHMYYFDNNGCALINTTYNNHNYGSNGYIIGNDILIEIDNILYDINNDIVTLHNHKIKHIEYKEKTCTEDGNKEYYYCIKCDKYYLDNTYTNEVSKDEVIIKASHNLTHYEEKQPTCTEEGYKAYDICNDCTFSTFESLSIINCISSNWIIDTDATCTEKGSKHKKCTMCKKTLETEEIKAKGHNYVDGKCIMCGKQESSTNEIVIDNGYIYFGEYPQTLKKESVTITSSTPNSDGYYLGSDGERYAKVKAMPYENSYVFNDKTTSIVEGNTYYFKVEPIKWKILEQNNGTYKLISTIILDNQMFYSSWEDRTIEGQTIYANNYEYSDIRKWLNNAFLNKAFTKQQQTYINTTIVDNSLSSTGYSINPYICNNTLDKIYLPSVEEMTNTSYGYSSSSWSDSTRQKQLTDYAKALGCYMETYSSYYNNGSYWLRSPIYYYSYHVRFVSLDGNISNYNFVLNSYVGVAPALSITIK